MKIRLLCYIFCGVWLFTQPSFFFAEEEYHFHGKHFIASYLECNEEAIKDNGKLRDTLIEAARASGAQVLDFVDFTFSPPDFCQNLNSTRQ